jgi:hypothetical protein
MFIAANHIQLQDKKDHCLRRDTYAIYWRGFVYVDGVPAGGPSIEKFADEIAIRNLAAESCRLKGVYFVAVHDRLSGDCYAFVDGSGLFHAFSSEQFAGTSFLELAEAEHLRVSDLDAESLVEFFHFGNVYSGKTLFPNIGKIVPEAIVCIPRIGPVSLQPRPLRDVAEPPARSFEESIKSFVVSAAGQRVSVDLTGGIDSRLLAVVLQSLGLPFEVATCGIKSDPDVLIAQQVADALGLELHVTEREMDDGDWRDVFRDCDGLFDVVRAYSQMQMRKERLQRGISLVVSGVGGELLKDFWWLQDIPFYGRMKPDLDKLYAFRVSPAPLQHSYLSEPFRAVSLNYRERTLNTLSEYIVPGNTWTYDQIYYGFKMREVAGRSLTNNLHEIACYAPYLEREVAAFGYQLPRRRRFFNNFHRQTITALNSRVARIPTTEGGISVSAESSAICRDSLRYVSDKLSRLTNKLGQRIFNHGYRAGNFDAKDIAASVRGITTQRRTLDHLKDSGIVRRDLQFDQIGTDYLGRMLSLDMLLERLESVRAAANSSTAAVEAA